MWPNDRNGPNSAACASTVERQLSRLDAGKFLRRTLPRSAGNKLTPADTFRRTVCSSGGGKSSRPANQSIISRTNSPWLTGMPRSCTRRAARRRGRYRDQSRPPNAARLRSGFRITISRESPSSPLGLRRARLALRAPRDCATRSPKGEAWWSQAGSNRRPLACHASALPAELWPRRIAAPQISVRARP